MFLIEGIFMRVNVEVYVYDNLKVENKININFICVCVLLFNVCRVIMGSGVW